jgi:hypothetical protein
MHVTGNKYQWQAILRPSLVKVGMPAVDSTSDSKVYTLVTSNFI